MSETSTQMQIRGFKSKVLEYCSTREIEYAINMYNKAMHMCLPSDPLYNGLMEAHSHIINAIKEYIHFVLSPDCRVRPPKGKIVWMMDYAHLSNSDLNPTESQILASC